jgi:hypothetical protein
MKCGHCLTDFHSNLERYDLGRDIESDWIIYKFTCPTCNKFNLYLIESTAIRTASGSFVNTGQVKMNKLIHPKAISRIPISPEVPTDFLREYEEACMVISDSPMASAALSRRSLQHILRDKGKFKAKSLAEEIQQAIDSKTLPSYITESIDAIRNIGNFAAHPLKSTNTGEIMPVEPGEAEWNLDVVELLFDFYFVQPSIIQKKRDELNKKLSEAGKPPMK